MVVVGHGDAVHVVRGEAADPPLQSGRPAQWASSVIPKLERHSTGFLSTDLILEFCISQSVKIWYLLLNGPFSDCRLAGGARTLVRMTRLRLRLLQTAQQTRQ